MNISGQFKQLRRKYLCLQWTLDKYGELIYQNGPSFFIKSPITASTESETSWYLELEQLGFSIFQLDVYLQSCKRPLSEVVIEVNMKYGTNFCTPDFCFKPLFHKREWIGTMDKRQRHQFLIYLETSDADMLKTLSRYNSHEYKCEPFTIPEIICTITWNNSDPKIYRNPKNDDLKNLLQNEKLSDVKLIVGSRVFNVHKAILASRSPVFLAMFQNNMAENIDNRVLISDTTEDIMKIVLAYIYTDEVQDIDCKAADVLAVAHKYDLKGLVDICADALGKSLNLNNVLEYFSLADLYNIEGLRTRCLKFFNKHKQAITIKPEFSKRHPNFYSILAQSMYHS